MDWFLLFIPFIAVIVAVLGFTRRFAIWEYAVLFSASALVVVAGHYMAANSLTSAKEYWGSYGVNAVHSERWNEYIHQTCTRENCSGSGENRSCTTETYDCSYVDDHPEYWELTDNMGDRHRISQHKYHEITSKWKTEHHIKRHRGCHTICGDVYGAAYPMSGDTTLANMIPLTTTHTYENRVKASTSVFNFMKVDSLARVTYGLYDHPRVTDKFLDQPILGINSAWASHKLRALNAINGSSRQLRMMIVVFEDKPYEAGLMQEAYWVGGNKNEFILVIGKKGDQIKWTKVISWTEEIGLKMKVEREVKAMSKFNLVGIVDYMGSNVPMAWKRKSFKDFNYLKVEIPIGTVIWMAVINLVLTIGLMVFFILNGVESHLHESTHGRPKNRRRSDYYFRR